MNFNQMSLNELLELNKEICSAISKKRTAEASAKVMNIAVGDKVKYAGSAKCAPFIATVEKVLRVNIDVITDQGKKWRIHAAALSKV